ncbi:MAG: 4Fe-4S dicluster domain-containing protein [Anaerolineales bacterium]|nr:4Fe-4S dicluster domain-containing protein [Anaerolineales bacterium]
MEKKKKIRVNAELCRDCQLCVLSCSLVHNGVSNPLLSRIHVNKDMEKYEFNISICQHCPDPECVQVCPAGALEIDERGVVVFDQATCIQCGECAEACPYESIFFYNDMYFKCELCKGRESGPLCVEICPAGVLELVEREE